MAVMSVPSSTLVSWTFVILIALGATFYYNPYLIQQYTPEFLVKSFAQKPILGNSPDEKKPIKKLKQRAINNTGQKKSGDEFKAGVTAIQVTGNVTARTQGGQKASLPRDQDGDMSNREFAQQLARAQAGTKLEPKPSPAVKPAKRKQKSKPAANTASSPSLSSSTTGGDGDDDMSPASSPISRPVSTAATSRAGDVSDMLEPASPKAMTLSIVNVDSTPKQSKPKKTVYEVALSKKQRQNQKRNAENAQMVKESTDAHILKGREQSRANRMAEGTSKQGKASSFKHQENVWAKSQKPSTAPAAPTQLLDTMEPAKDKDSPAGAILTKPMSDITNQQPAATTTSEIKPVVGEARMSALGASEREAPAKFNWADDAEDDRLRQLGLLDDDQNEWQDVTNKRNKKKGRLDTDTSSETSSGFAHPNRTAAAKTAVNGTSKRPEHANRFQSFEGKLD